MKAHAFTTLKEEKAFPHHHGEDKQHLPQTMIVHKQNVFTKVFYSIFIHQPLDAANTKKRVLI